MLISSVSLVLRNGSWCGGTGEVSHPQHASEHCAFTETVTTRGGVSTLFSGASAGCTYCRQQAGGGVVLLAPNGIELAVAPLSPGRGTSSLKAAVTTLDAGALPNSSSMAIGKAVIRREAAAPPPASTTADGSV
eukprot:gene41968-59671_t